MSAQDDALRIYLIALGHNVTVRDEDEISSSDAIGKALVIISESVESSSINTLFRHVAVPILTWEGWLQDDLGMTAEGDNGSVTDSISSTTNSTIPQDPNVPQDPSGAEDKDEGAYGENVDQTEIRIINPAHPLAAGYNGIVTTVRGGKNKFHWGVPNANAVIIAHDIDDPNHRMIYSYDRGVMMVDLIAPARRVFIHNATAPNLTTEGLAIFLNAVYWTMGCLEVQVTPTPTATLLPTMTPSATLPATVTPTATDTPLPTLTTTPTVLATVTPVATVTPTVLPSVTSALPTVTATATSLNTTTPTETPIPNADGDRDTNTNARTERNRDPCPLSDKHCHAAFTRDSYSNSYLSDKQYFFGKTGPTLCRCR